MSIRAQFDEIRDSLVNGQRTQAYNQMLVLGAAEMPAMLEYFHTELNSPDIALDAAKTYFYHSAR